MCELTDEERDVVIDTIINRAEHIENNRVVEWRTVADEHAALLRSAAAKFTAPSARPDMEAVRQAIETLVSVTHERAGINAVKYTEYAARNDEEQAVEAEYQASYANVRALLGLAPEG